MVRLKSVEGPLESSALVSFSVWTSAGCAGRLVVTATGIERRAGLTGTSNHRATPESSRRRSRAQR